MRSVDLSKLKMKHYLTLSGEIFFLILIQSPINDLTFDSKTSRNLCVFYMCECNLIYNPSLKTLQYKDK